MVIELGGKDFTHHVGVYLSVIGNALSITTSFETPALLKYQRFRLPHPHAFLCLEECV